MERGCFCARKEEGMAEKDEDEDEGESRRLGWGFPQGIDIIATIIFVHRITFPGLLTGIQP